MTAQEAHQHPRFQRMLRWGHVLAWVVLVGVILGLGVSYQQTQDTAHKAKRTADALALLVAQTRHQAKQLKQVVDDTHAGGCALRTDLIERAHGTLAYLKDHPGGIAGVSPDVLRSNARSQLKSAHTLNRLNC